MSRRRHTLEQVVRMLREADRLLGEGSELPEVLKQLEIAEATYHRWRNQYGGMKADDVKRLKELDSPDRGGARAGRPSHRVEVMGQRRLGHAHRLREMTPGRRRRRSSRRRRG